MYRYIFCNYSLEVWFTCLEFLKHTIVLYTSIIQSENMSISSGREVEISMDYIEDYL